MGKPCHIYPPPMFESYLKKILTARVYDVAVETPCQAMPRMSRKLGLDVRVKREDLQPVHSFKIRGAYQMMSGLPRPALEAGVLAASAGNHAQGVAIAARKLGTRATIVMPATTPAIKAEAVRQYGAEVVLHGDRFDEALAHARLIQKNSKTTFIPPYDDPEIIVGQGTVGLEILNRHREPLDALFLPVGGGGLAAGVAACWKSVRPETRIIAVEAEDSACLQAALKAGHPVQLDHVGIFADGVAVAKIGEEPFRVLKETVDEVVTVNTDEICAAIKDTFDDTRAIAEPAGALALAGLTKMARESGVQGQRWLWILSGANMNFDRLRHISERSEMGEHREAVFGVRIPERQGTFRRLCETLGKRNITEFNYRFADEETAVVYLGVQTGGNQDERQAILKGLTDGGFQAEDFTTNELAKLHVRHLVGGHASRKSPERVFRFEFPERPGALMEFLQTLGSQRYITLFHYRNHGSAFGRVFIGIRADAGDAGELEEAFYRTRYTFQEETDNTAYQLFLGS